MVLRKITKRLQWESEIKLERLKRKVANLSCSLKKYVDDSKNILAIEMFL